MSKIRHNIKGLSQEEFEKKLRELNGEYVKQRNIQLLNWINGVPIHNNADHWAAIIDAENNNQIIELTYIGNVECCPDFSCCGVEMMPLNKRLEFLNNFLKDKIKYHE